MWHSLPVNDLRLLGLSDNGKELLLESEDGTIFNLRINDHLKDTVIDELRETDQPLAPLAHISHSGQLSPAPEINGQPIVTVKEVQARLRSGESFDVIARTTSWTIEKIEKFSGPILQERAYIIGLALKEQLRKDKSAPTLADATISQLEPRGVDMTLVEWNAWREPDGSWNVILTYPNKEGTSNEARWIFDLENRSLVAKDDGAAWIAGEELNSRQATASHGIVQQPMTPAPRLVSVKNDHEASGIDNHEEGNIPSSSSPLEAIIDSGPSTDTRTTSGREGKARRLKIPSWDDIMFGGPKETFGGPKETFGEVTEPSEEE
jgi:Protein of unknown function (DUF3071)